MAENESKSETTLISIKENQKNDGPLALFTIFQNFGLKSKPESSSTQTQVVVQTTTITTEGEESVSKKPDIVRFPDARQDFSSLKLTVEESEQGVSPKHMWQVYALGGFMIVRWMWARWKEAKANKPGNPPPSGDEEPHHIDD